MMERADSLPQVWTATDWKLGDFLVQLYASSLFVFCVALALRTAVFAMVWHRQGMAASGEYGYEVGGIAAAIAGGKGFSSPFLLFPTGPTAWVCPLYPYFVAAVFKIWGTFTPGAHIVLDLVNCMFSALVILPIRACAKRCFSPAVAVASCWLWTFLPFAWWIPVQYVWDTTLTALVLSTLLWATLVIAEHRSLLHWIAYGALWAAGALINASILALLPFFFVWLALQLRYVAIPLRFLCGALFACVLLLTPWVIRNHQVFGKWIPLRSNFGMELWLGNNPSGEDVNSFASHPLWNAVEAQTFQQTGEINYVQAKQRAALSYIRSHPAATFHSIMDRIWNTWFAVTDRPHASWSTSPMYVRLLLAANFLMVVIGAAGLYFAVCDIGMRAIPCLTTMLIFPIPYYLTHTLVRYRFPIEPVLTILCVYGFVRVVARKPVGKAAPAVADSGPAVALGLISRPSERLA